MCCFGSLPLCRIRTLVLGSYDRLEKFRFGRSRSLPTPARLGQLELERDEKQLLSRTAARRAVRLAARDDSRPAVSPDRLMEFHATRARSSE